MVLGMYAGPMCLWPWALDGKIEGTGSGANPTYYGKHIALKVNGENYPMPCNGALAVDPTHPAVKLNIEKFMKKWAGWGVKYVKADFLNCGIIEGDSWYDPEITTGVMAYNYGMIRGDSWPWTDGAHPRAHQAERGDVEEISRRRG